MPPSVPESGDNSQTRREWSDIQQADHGRSTTGVARKRKWTRIWRWTALVMLAAVICGALAYASVSASKDSNSLEPSASLEKVTFRTDGVLNDKWLAKALEVRHGMSMTSVDIAKIRQLLEANGQIKSAAVTLHLPNELVVEVRERMPILRAQAQVASGIVKTLLISSDGTIYTGSNYPANTIRALPYVDGVVFRKNGDGYEPLGDIQPVAKLLDTARTGWPKFYRDWHIVSLKRYRGSDSLMSNVEIQSKTLGKLTLSVKDVDNQMRRLAQALASGAASDGRQIVGVNLSIPGQAIVDYSGVAQPAAKQPVARPAVAKPAPTKQPVKGR